MPKFMSTPSLRSRTVYLAMPSMLAACWWAAMRWWITSWSFATPTRSANSSSPTASPPDWKAPASNRSGQERLLRNILEEHNVRAAVLTFADGRDPIHAGPRLRPAAQQQNTVTGPRMQTDSSWQLSREIHPGVTATLTVEFSRDGQYIATLEGVITLILIMVAVILIAMVPALRFSRQLTQPLSELAVAVRRIRDGDLETDFRTGATGELGELETALRQMVLALDDAQTELQQNVDQATQDLRETLETIEIQNIELDMARKEALKASQIKSEFPANKPRNHPAEWHPRLHQAAGKITMSLASGLSQRITRAPNPCWRSLTTFWISRRLKPANCRWSTPPTHA